MTNIGFVSLGCSKNLIDTEVMLKKLADAGILEAVNGFGKGKYRFV